MAGIHNHTRKDSLEFCQQQLCCDRPGVQCRQAPGKWFKAKLRTANQIQKDRESHNSRKEDKSRVEVQ